MGDYFKPWRRKIGVVMLVVALMVAGIWVRSFVVDDRIMIGDITGTYSVFYGLSGIGTVRNSVILFTYKVDASAPAIPGVMKVPTLKLAPLFVIPLWPVACPATLLSAYLLLSKPRRNPELR